MHDNSRTHGCFLEANDRWDAIGHYRIGRHCFAESSILQKDYAQAFAIASKEFVLRRKSCAKQNSKQAYSWAVETLLGGVQVSVALNQGAQQALCSPAAHYFCSCKGITAAYSLTAAIQSASHASVSLSCIKPGYCCHSAIASIRRSLSRLCGLEPFPAAQGEATWSAQRLKQNGKS